MMLTNSEIDELQITLLRLAMKLGSDELESKFAKLCAQARANAQGEAVAGVPVSLINAMAATFECYALTGMAPKLDDGTKTPNAINCERYAKQLNEILASVGIPSAPMPDSLPDEPPHMSHADNCHSRIKIDSDSDYSFGNTQQYMECSCDLEYRRQKAKDEYIDALRAHMGRKS